MKELKRKVTITYRWWNDDRKAIKPEHVTVLEALAMERIQEQMGQGYTSGELCGDVHIADIDPEHGVGYGGWWEVQTK